MPNRVLLGGMAVFLGVAASVAAADDPQGLEIHELHVWVGDATLGKLNAQGHFPSAMPGAVDSMRGRRIGHGRKPSPMSLMTFYGPPVADFEIDLRVKSGRFLAHWPGARRSSGRLRWFDVSLTTEPADSASMALVTPGHWFEKARKGEGLFLLKGARTERFVTYDVEITHQIHLKLKSGPDKYEVINNGPHAIYDVAISAPSEGGRRIGWLDMIPAAQGTDESTAAASNDQQDSPTVKSSQDASSGPAIAEIVMSEAMLEGSDELAAITSEALSKRLMKTGLHQHEIDLLLANYHEPIFNSDDLVLLFRYPSSMIDETLPLAIYPEPAKSVRVALVIVRNVDPKAIVRVEGLIAKLGHPEYVQREDAHQRLLEIGSVAITALTKAREHKDPEIAYRVKRILRRFDKQGGNVPSQ